MRLVNTLYEPLLTFQEDHHYPNSNKIEYSKKFQFSSPITIELGKVQNFTLTMTHYKHN